MNGRGTDMRCYDCRKATSPDDSAIRGRNVPSNRWGAKVGYREFRRIRLCRACMGDFEWGRVLRSREETARIQANKAV